MANTTYIKGVRTRYRNILSSEIVRAKDIRIQADILKQDNSGDIEQAISDATKSFEKIKAYCEKVETQSEKLATAIGDSDQDTTDWIIDEDCKLCSEAMEVYLDLKQSKRELVLMREKHHQVKSENVEEPVTTKLVQLQEDMQQLLSSQMKQQEIRGKKEKEQVSSVKLPTIDIISFSGDKTKWIEFWDSFQCAVHENKKISKVEKFNYLRSKLVGEARSAIAGIALSNDNYPMAVDLLAKRFGNPQEIIDLHYNQLINMPPATTKLTSLRNMLDKVEKNMRSLEVLKQNIGQDVFVSIIRSKLPEEVLIQLEIQNGTDQKWTVVSLTKRLQEYVIARERAVHVPKSANDNKSSSSNGFQNSMSVKADTRRRYGPDSETRNITQTLSTNSAKWQPARKSQESTYKKCRYCQQQHWSDECKEYQTINDRRQRIKGSCYKCLRDGHFFKDCKTNKACVYCGEMNVHHRSLCPKKFQFKHYVSKVAIEVKEPHVKTEESGLMSTNEMVLMQTALTEVGNPETNETAPVRLFLDTGSHRSYITENLAQKLNLKEEGEQDIHIVTFGCKKARKFTTKCAGINVKLKSGLHLQITANIVPVISGELQRVPVKDLQSDTVQDIVRTVELADTIPTENETAPIELLIGNDYYMDLVHGEKIQVQAGLYLLASKLGWILSGRVTDSRDIISESSMLILTCGSDMNKTGVFSSIDASLHIKPNLEDFWNIESIGIIDKETRTDDMIAMEKFNETLQFEENRYQVTWPWKEDKPDLPTNRDLALKRLKTSVYRMRNKPDILQKYNAIVSDQLVKGVIEKVEDNESTGILHYLPHHAVITPQKTTTKLRVVYDASAKTRKENNSLNDCLYRGPVMIHDLCGMLIRFRLHPVAMVADIEKAFLQIGLQNDQRDVTRFLWLKDIHNLTTNSDNIQEYRFCRVPFGIISSPFLLGAAIEHHLDSYNCDIAEKIKSDIYVDNLITGTRSVNEAKDLYTAAKKMFKEGSMNIREWISNREEVNETFDKNDKADLESMKVLGHHWDVKEDTLAFKPMPTHSASDTVTKRTVLKQLASLYDPLGLVCPVIVRGKSFLQHLWSKHLDWDDPLDEDDQQQWCACVKDMDQLSQFRVQRCISRTNTRASEYRLLCFCDASEKAYAAAIYLHKTLDQENKSCSQLVFAKTRLAPVKKLSIPRLELLAVVIGMRCISFVKDQIQLPIVESYVWSDSQCVLHWITSDKKLSVFVRNRVKEIRDVSGDTTMAYVPTKENPADVASRGTSITKLSENELWWNGPKWLSNHPREWPTFDTQMDDSSEKNKYESEIHEQKEEVTLVQHPHSSGEDDIPLPGTQSPFGIDSNQFSSQTRILRVTALALRFVRKLQRRPCSDGYITTAEIRDAEVLWLKHVQVTKYMNVFAGIMDGKETCLQRQLGLYIDNSGLLRCKGRLENACLSESARCPILLPKDNRYTHLVVEKAHKGILHSGVSQTLSAIRMRYWIPHGRATVKAVLKSCCVCRRYEGGPYKLPPMCSYPKSRVTEASPFSRVGLDYMGPLWMKADGKQQKVWICLFTCLVTRAIHLELVCDMSTSEFLMCFRRFVSQRGTPSEITSDNALQFRAASNVLQHIWKNIHKNDEVLSYVSNAGIHWRFNVELAPWMGGFYERLVGLVKRSLRKTVGRRLLTMIQLQTLLKEIESVLNSRPLVYVGDDVNSNIPLTPASFLTLNPRIGIPETETSDDSDYQPVESTCDRLLQIWKKGQRLLDMFWEIWRKEYLTSLRERTQTSIKSARTQVNIEPKENDIVLIKDNLPRGSWKFGRVNKLVRSRDGYIRSVKVVIPSGKELGRPVNLLYPLEISSTKERLVEQNPQVIQVPTERPKRRAFDKASRNIRMIMRSEDEDTN